nr:LytTR family transcriptional regulator [Bacteroidota bacterium]
KAQEKLLAGGKQANPIVKETTERAADEFIFIKADSRIHKVNFNEICFVEAYGDYVKIHLAGRQIVTYSSLKNISQLLPGDQFFRVHKSFLVAINKMEVIEGNTILINNNEIPIGKSYRRGFFMLINLINK